METNTTWVYQHVPPFIRFVHGWRTHRGPVGRTEGRSGGGLQNEKLDG